MSEFERLRDAFARAVDKQDRYVADGQVFAQDLMERFREFLQCPREAIVMQPEDIDVRNEGATEYHVEEAVKLEGDSYFHFRITIELTPLRHISFPIAFKRRERAWHVKLSRAGTEYKIDPPRSDIDIDAMFRAWVTDAAEHFDTMLDAFLTHGRSRVGAEIGFKPDDG